MTTTDARKRNRDMTDAHETARARDARASTITVTFHADTSGFDRAIKRMTEQMAATAPTRREAIRRALAPLAEARPLTDFHREWLHVMDTQRPHTPQESDMTDHRAEAERIRDDERRVVKPSGTRMDGAIVHALLAIHDTLLSGIRRISNGSTEQMAHQTDLLTEIRDRMPEYVKPTLDWLDEPAPVPRPEPAPADVDPDEADPLAEVIQLAVGEELGWEYVAGSAREHIEAEPFTKEDGPVSRARWLAQQRRAEKAEADLARVTEERDTAERLANRNADTARDFEDRYETSHANFLAVSSDLDKVQAKADRYDALRADVEARYLMQDQPLYDHSDILARDDERAES